MAIKLEASYLSLPEIFYSKVHPARVSQPSVVLWNQDLADRLGLDSVFSDPEILSGNRLLPGTQPFSQAYGGHQFGHFNILGDGRAHVLTEIVDSRGARWDLQLKGSGATPYSRRGDGKAALGPMIREFLISEAMYFLGIPTTRSLAVVKTEDFVYRESRKPAGILSRIASSHIRVGTFQYAYAEGGPEALRALADYSILRHDPDLAEKPNRYSLFLDRVVERQAKLIAAWMNTGFIHGVMNTDNMTISGETIDYGPCAFMDEYHPATVFSSIDQKGRYAYGNQPAIGQWNLSRFAESLLAILSDDRNQAVQMAEESVKKYTQYFNLAFTKGLSEKLGFKELREQDLALFESVISWMFNNQVDYTSGLREISRPLPQRSLEAFKSAEFLDWESKWLERLKQEGSSFQAASDKMRQINPVVIPRNHLVESAIQDAVEHSDYSLVNKLLEVFKNPFEESDANIPYRNSQSGFSKTYKTFCGT